MQSALLSIVNDPGRHDPGRPVCLTADGLKTWRDLQRHAGRWQAAAACKERHLAVYHDDGFEFLSLLLAAWRQGKTAVVPANTLPATLKALAQSCSGFAGQFPEAYAPGSAPAPKAAPSRALQPRDPALVIFTSGSSGAPDAIPKDFRQLDNEIATLESQWGETLQDAWVSGTVSHHHFYGMLFRLLWPAAKGRVFMAEARNYLEEIAADCKRCRSLALVTSPAHLSRLPVLDWPLLRSRMPLVFSSGAPLPAEAAAEVHEHLRQEVTEVYGSSETGAIAWRRQLGSPYWIPLPGLKVGLDSQQRLKVTGPYLEGEGSYATQDRGELGGGGRFKLLGRMDRIAKIGGKRISLTQMEQALLAHGWVQQVRVCPHPDRPDRVCAAVQLSPTGAEALIDQGRQAVNAQLKASLASEIEAIALPRYWRYVPALPVDRQGKVTQAALAALFQKQEAAPVLPEVLEDRMPDARHRELLLSAPPSLLYFQGHFPGQPILPGIVQVHWAVHYGQEAFPACRVFTRMEAVKFQRVVLPGQRLALCLQHRREGNKLVFAYTLGDAPLSSGRICFAEAE